MGFMSSLKGAQFNEAADLQVERPEGNANH
jgi:hypothetical protein